MDELEEEGWEEGLSDDDNNDGEDVSEDGDFFDSQTGWTATTDLNVNVGDVRRDLLVRWKATVTAIKSRFEKSRDYSPDRSLVENAWAVVLAPILPHLHERLRHGLEVMKAASFRSGEEDTLLALVLLVAYFKQPPSVIANPEHSAMHTPIAREVAGNQRAAQLLRALDKRTGGDGGSSSFEGTAAAEFVLSDLDHAMQVSCELLSFIQSIHSLNESLFADTAFFKTGVLDAVWEPLQRSKFQCLDDR